MTRVITLILFLFAASFVVDVNADSEDALKAIFSIDKMTCATCPITVRKAMQRVDGVEEVTVDLDSKTAIVVYDASLTDVEEIAASSSDVGFPATPIENNVQ
jgi:mercuric ion binding protein